MIRGKAAIMFDPTKLLPQNQQNVDLLIQSRKNLDEPQSPTSASEPSTPQPQANPEGGDEQQNLNHFSRPKVAGRRQVRIVKQDNTQRRQQAALEIVQSEKMYYLMLDAFAKAFLDPLKENPSSFGIQPTHITSLSEALENIIEFSQTFGNNPSLGTDPGQVFEQHFQRLSDLYNLYVNKSIHHIYGILNDLTGQKRFRQHVRHVQGDLSMNIIDHFLIPTSRLQIYELMLRKYASSLEEPAQQEQLISLADRIKERTAELSDTIPTLEKSGRILSIQLQLSMVGSNVIYLWNPERELVHEAVTMKSKIDLKDVESSSALELKTHGENKRRMLLFNDQLMWTTDLPDMRYKGHVSLVDIAVETFGPAEMPALLVKQSQSAGPTMDQASTRKQSTSQATETTDASKEGWVLVFDDPKTRETWYLEIRNLQSQLRNLTSDSTLTIPIEVRDETKGGCCSIM